MYALLRVSFLWRVSTHRTQSAILFYHCCRSVRLSVCLIPVSCLNECTYRHIFWHSGRKFILVFQAHRCYYILRGSFSMGTLNKWGGNFFSRFSTDITVNLGNGSRWVHIHDYYESLIGSLTRLIDPCRFGWPWVTFKARRRLVNFFPADLRNYARLPFDLERRNFSK